MDLLSVKELQDKVEGAQGVFLGQVDDALLTEAGFLPTVAILPTDYKKRIAYLGNLVVQMCFSYQGEAKDTLVRIASALSYLINSTSFQEKKYFKYDKAEIGRKLLGLLAKKPPRHLIEALRSAVQTTPCGEYAGNECPFCRGESYLDGDPMHKDGCEGMALLNILEEGKDGP